MKGILPIATAAGLFAATLAHANDGTVARLADVNGNVLVSRDFNIASAAESARLAPGARVLVTANSSVTVVFDGGCKVKVAPGERLEIDAGACANLARETREGRKEGRS